MVQTQMLYNLERSPETTKPTEMSLPCNDLNTKKCFINKLEASAQSFKAKEKLAVGREE